MWHVCRKHRKWKRMCCFEGTCWNQIKAHAPKVKDTTWWCIRLRTGACNQSDNTPWWCMRNKMEEPQGKGQMGQRLAFYTSMKLYITSSVSVARPTLMTSPLGCADADLASNICTVYRIMRQPFCHSLSKSHFFVNSVSFLGHVISLNHSSPELKEAEALCAWLSPSLVKDLHSFLGLLFLQYLWKLFPQITTKMAMLTALLLNKTAEKAYELPKYQLSQVEKH